MLGLPTQWDFVYSTISQLLPQPWRKGESESQLWILMPIMAMAPKMFFTETNECCLYHVTSGPYTLGLELLKRLGGVPVWGQLLIWLFHQELRATPIAMLLMG